MSSIKTDQNDSNREGIVGEIDAALPTASNKILASVLHGILPTLSVKQLEHILAALKVDPIEGKVAGNSGHISGPVPLDQLNELLRTGAAVGMRRHAIQELGKMGAEAVPALSLALHDSDVREDAARALASIGRPALPTLLSALRDESSYNYDEIQNEAARALGSIGAAEAVPALLDAMIMKANRGFSIGAVRGALISIQDPSAVPALIKALQHELGMVGITEALVEKGVTAVPALIGVLADKTQEPRLRSLVTYALGGIGAETSVPTLIEALQDESADVRAAAAKALGMHKIQSAVPALITALKDESAAVRRKAAESLGQIGNKDAIAPLRERLRFGGFFGGERDDYVRKGIKYALSELKEK